MKVTFGIFADLHSDYMHDGVTRMEAFLAECQSYGVDFAVQLGDFLQPQSAASVQNRRILEMLWQQRFPFYHVLGNHDMDHSTKDAVLAMLGQPSAVGSFDCGGVHFVYLDANWYFDGAYEPYGRGNYKQIPDSAAVSVLPPEQLAWLREDLRQAQYPSVLFSHQSLIESRTGIANAEELRVVLREAPKGVLMCVCGHEHVDRLEEREGICYYCLNSMSYYWAGSHYSHSTYGEALESRFPHLCSVFPYEKPLYAMISIDDSGITVTGRETAIVGALPEELNFQKPGLRDPVAASIQNRRILLDKAKQ